MVTPSFSHVAKASRTDHPGASTIQSDWEIQMELLLLSLAGCSAMDVIAILRKMHQPVEHLEVRVCGQRRDEHPTIFTSIQLEFIAHGAVVDGAAVARAIDLSCEWYCPVWAMLGRVSVSSRRSASSSMTQFLSGLTESFLKLIHRLTGTGGATAPPCIEKR